jgi:hypothetical protein
MAGGQCDRGTSKRAQTRYHRRAVIVIKTSFRLIAFVHTVPVN